MGILTGYTLASDTSITISFPNWFYVVCSVGVISFIFWAGYNCKSVYEVCKEFPKIRRALDLISQLLLSHEWIDEHVYVSSQSPLSLTENGRKMLKESGFEEFFEANKQEFFSGILLQKPKSAAEVEMAAKNLMLYLDIKETPKRELVENYAYNHGQQVAKLLFAYSIEIRDRYLKEYPFQKK